MATAEDKRLAVSGLQKRQAGKKPTRDESNAIIRVEKEKEEQDAQRLLRRISKKIYSEMSGRQQKILNEQAGRHNLPLLGSHVDLFAIIRRFHDILAERQWVDTSTDEENLGGSDSPNLERMRAARADIWELELEVKRGSYLPVDEVHKLLGELAAILRAAGEQLQKQCGAEARDVMEEALQEFLRRVEERLANDCRNGEATHLGNGHAQTS